MAKTDQKVLLTPPLIENYSIKQQAKLYELFVELAETSVKAVIEKHNDNTTKKRGPHIWLLPEAFALNLKDIIREKLNEIKKAAEYSFDIKRQLNALEKYREEQRKIRANLLKKKRNYLKELNLEAKILCGKINTLHDKIKRLGIMVLRIPQGHIKPTLGGENLPKGPGIYFVWEDGKIKYIGQSIRINQRCRLESHHIIKKGSLLSWLPCPVTELNYVEAFYIGLLKPELNFGMRNRQQGQTSEGINYASNL